MINICKKRAGNKSPLSYRYMVGNTGLEPVTPTMSTWYSDQAELIAHIELTYKHYNIDVACVSTEKYKEVCSSMQ